MKVHVIRLKQGQDLEKSIQKFAKDNNILAAAVITAVGSLEEIQIRPADDKDLIVRKEKFEIVSLVGTISTNGEHLHISVADSGGAVCGGHLRKGNVVYTTAEIVIAELDGHAFERIFDETTGYKELVAKKH